MDSFIESEIWFAAKTLKLKKILKVTISHTAYFHGYKGLFQGIKDFRLSLNNFLGKTEQVTWNSLSLPTKISFLPTKISF